MVFIGFSSGSIYWDDEDTYNMNGKGGYLPSGSFDSDTRINYCCRYSLKGLDAWSWTFLGCIDLFLKKSSI